MNEFLNCFKVRTLVLVRPKSIKLGQMANLNVIFHVMVSFNVPFPSCCLSRFRSESWCSTIVREMSLICIRIRNSFPFQWLCSRTRFETEACSNSEMGYLSIGSNLKLSPVPCTFPEWPIIDDKS